MISRSSMRDQTIGVCQGVCHLGPMQHSSEGAGADEKQGIYFAWP